MVEYLPLVEKFRSLINEAKPLERDLRPFRSKVRGRHI
jgi:hypothetical protein